MAKSAWIEPPDGILLTLPVAFFQDRGMSYSEFMPLFKKQMSDPDNVWNYRLTNLPTMDVQYVYLVFDGFVQYRGNLVMYQRGVTKRFNDSPDMKFRTFAEANWVIFTGPIVVAPIDIEMKGFQGFRYTKKLF